MEEFFFVVLKWINHSVFWYVVSSISPARECCHLRSDKRARTQRSRLFQTIDTNYVQMFDNLYFNFHYCRGSFIFMRARGI